jgi:hypothetical protein
MEGQREPSGMHPFRWGRIDIVASRERILRTRRGKELGNCHTRSREQPSSTSVKLCKVYILDVPRLPHVVSLLLLIAWLGYLLESAGKYRSLDISAGHYRTYTTFTPALIDTKHGDISSIRGMLVHTLLAHDNAYRLRRSRRYCLKGHVSGIHFKCT